MLPQDPKCFACFPKPTVRVVVDYSQSIACSLLHSRSSTANSSVDDGSLSRKLAAEKESATEADAVQAKTAERVENEFRSFFNCIPRVGSSQFRSQVFDFPKHPLTILPSLRIVPCQRLTKKCKQ